MAQFADLLSLSRLAIAPILPLVAALDLTSVTVALLGWGLVSDAVDGTVARLTGSTSERGAQLDSLCDVAFYAAGILAFAIAFPAARSGLELTWAVTAAALVVPSLLGWLRFASLPSYHTILSRLTLILFGMALASFVMSGITWPFRAAAVVAVLAALDDMLITLLLPAPRSHVPHSLSLVRRRARQAALQPEPDPFP